MAVRNEIETAHERMSNAYCAFGVGIPAEHAQGTKCRGMNCVAFDIVDVVTVEMPQDEMVEYVTVCGQKLKNAQAKGSVFEIPVYGCLRMGAPARLTHQQER